MENNRLDITLVVDTSGSQSASPAVVELINRIMLEFDTQNVVKIALVAYGDYRKNPSEVETVMGPVTHANSGEIRFSSDYIFSSF